MSVLDQIGHTPLVRIEKLSRGVRHVEIWAKVESRNPAGSVKDRPALRMIEDGERSGALTRDKIILDSTSGNTGVAYAMIGAAKGYRVELVMPANASLEKRRVITAYGAQIVFTDPMRGSDGAQREAERLYAEHPERYFQPDQYNNPSNWKAHYDTTGPEIIEQTQGRVTHFLAGVGTGGTIMGVSRQLKEFDPRIQAMAVEPVDPFHGIEGLKNMASSIVPGIYDERLLDGSLYVGTEEAYAMARRLAREEGLLVGQSSGAAMKAALDLAHQLREGLIVIIFPDSGDRYFSTRTWIWDEVEDDHEDT